MIQIRSFLRSSGGTFVLVEEARGPLVDEDYVEGAIELTVNGAAILDRSMWDYVDQLWAYIVDMCVNLENSGTAFRYFPDQPIEFRWESVGTNSVEITLRAGEDVRTVRADQREFLAAIRESAGAFFRAMSTLSSQDYSPVLDRLSQ